MAIGEGWISADAVGENLRAANGCEAVRRSGCKDQFAVFPEHQQILTG